MKPVTGGHTPCDSTGTQSIKFTETENRRATAKLGAGEGEQVRVSVLPDETVAMAAQKYECI